MSSPNALKVVAHGDREIVITRSLNAPRTLVFDAFTKPELLRKWLLGPPGWTMIVCEVDLRVGGAYRYVWQNTKGTVMGMGGVMHEIVPPERVTFDYFRRRYLRLGQSNGRQLAMAGFSGRAAEAAKSMVFLALLWTYPVTERFGGWLYFRCFSKFWYSRGLLQGLRGMATEEMS